MAHVAAGARISSRGELSGGGELAESGMMVLLVKQVHLQNEGGAIIISELFSLCQ